jgi:hypothetical protein
MKITLLGPLISRQRKISIGWVTSLGSTLDGCDGMGEYGKLATGKDCKSVSRAHVAGEKHVHSTTCRRIYVHRGLGERARCPELGKRKHRGVEVNFNEGVCSNTSGRTGHRRRSTT